MQKRLTYHTFGGFEEYSYEDEKNRRDPSKTRSFTDQFHTASLACTQKYAK